MKLKVGRGEGISNEILYYPKLFSNKARQRR